MKLIVGLGNPGKTYIHSRHNVGYRCLNYFAKLHSIRFERKQCQARLGAAEVAGGQILLAKPQIFVNLSGKAVSCLVRKHNIPLNDLLVIYDDLDLPLGRIRLRPSGGSGGHKGMKSIISALGSEDFPRVRAGIGRPPASELPNEEDIIVNYVLGDFTPQEEEVLKPVIAIVAKVIDCLLTRGVETAMSEFNR
jgi:PTH1 family peptidyl-tRNA hydrolase